MERVLFGSSDRQLGLLVILQIWRDLFLGLSLSYAGGRGEVVSLERGYWSEGGVLPFFLDFIDGRQRVLVQDSTETSHGRRATAICAFLHAAGLFIDSQSLVGDGAFLDLAMMEARRFFRHAPWRRWSWATTAGIDRCRKP
jgi:hypothetical protein